MASVNVSTKKVFHLPPLGCEALTNEEMYKNTLCNLVNYKIEGIYIPRTKKSNLFISIAKNLLINSRFHNTKVQKPEIWDVGTDEVYILSFFYLKKSCLFLIILMNSPVSHLGMRFRRAAGEILLRSFLPSMWQSSEGRGVKGQCWSALHFTGTTCK